MEFDLSLCLIVHLETLGECNLTASLNRFGGLTVIVTVGNACLYQGDNILAGRDWANTYLKRERERIAFESEKARQIRMQSRHADDLRTEAREG